MDACLLLPLAMGSNVCVTWVRLDISFRLGYLRLLFFLLRTQDRLVAIQLLFGTLLMQYHGVGSVRAWTDLLYIPAC
jgi:hypothetical protein